MSGADAQQQPSDTIFFSTPLPTRATNSGYTAAVSIFGANKKNYLADGFFFIGEGVAG